MKHIFSFLLVIVLLTISFVFSETENKIFTLFKQGECEFVVSKTVDISFLEDDAKIVYNGDDIIITVNSRIAGYVYKRLGQVKGFSFKLNTDFESFKNIISFKYFKGNNANNQTCYYGFASSLKNFVFVDGKKVNMHIVESDNSLIIGFPIILTSY